MARKVIQDLTINDRRDILFPAKFKNIVSKAGKLCTRMNGSKFYQGVTSNDLSWFLWTKKRSLPAY